VARSIYTVRRHLDELLKALDKTRERARDGFQDALDRLPDEVLRSEVAQVLSDLDTMSLADLIDLARRVLAGLPNPPVDATAHAPEGSLLPFKPGPRPPQAWT